MGKLKRSAFSLKETLLFLAVIAGLLLLTFGIKQLIFHSNSKEPSISWEMKVKDLILKNIQYGTTDKIINNSTISNALETISSRLISHMETAPPYDIQIVVMDSHEVNAITLPGGLIIVYQGLIEEVDNPEEMAAVLAHEMGHVINKDSAKKLTGSLGLAILLNLSGGGGNGNLNQLIHTLFLNGYSRQIEYNADQLGCDYLLDAGISPQNMIDFFDKIKHDNNELSQYTQILATHPLTEDRITAVSNRISELKGKPYKYPVNWKRVQYKIKTF